MRKLWVVLIGIIILGLVNYSIYSREQLVHNGRSVFLELAPVDPRSLMQGDYMALRFAVTAKAYRALNKSQEAATSQAKSSDGYIVLALDKQGIGRFSRIDDSSEIKDNEVKMLYRKRGHKMKFATNAFFFQEGKAKRYEAAKYGEFKVAENGDSILVDMWDEGLVKIEP
ncbi:MAG: GDYXXLXY domain-containing protein [Leucothrix sp.]